MEKTQQENRIGRDFTMWQLIKFALPAILTHLFTQLFRSVDDGLFVSRYVGESALASISLMKPVESIIMAFAQLFSIGASTLSAQYMGNHNQTEAKRIFTRIIIIGLILGIAFALALNIFCEPIARFMGADDSTIDNAKIYTRIVLTDAPINILVAIFGAYYSTAGKPQMGLVCSITSGIVNIVFDILFIPVMQLGVVGSSLSTVLGEIAICSIGMFFYSRRSHEIHFVKPAGNYGSTLKAIWKSGFSQFINSISFSATNLVTNKTLLSYLGSNGIAANSIIGDLRIILNAAFVGYVGCVGPIIAYNYGSGNVKRLKKILTHNLRFWFYGTVGVTLVGQLLKVPLITVFFGHNISKELFDMIFLGLTIEYCACPFTCGCIFVMRMFVALGNPRTASILTTLRNFAFRISMVLLMPALFGEIGVWLAFPVAEFISFMLASTLVYYNRDNYGYGKSGVALKMQGDYLLKTTDLVEDDAD